MANESVAWIDPSATSHALDGSSTSNPLALRGRQGIGMPPIANLDQRTPLRPGTTIRFVDIQPRVVTVPLLVSGNGSETTLRTTLRSMMTWFNTTSTPGTLRATAPDSTQRDLTAYYYAGLELAEDEQDRGPGWQLVPLQLLAADPFWYDTSATTTTYTNTQMGSTQTITNTGDYLVYPTWTITGPFTNLVITNTTTGYKIDLSGGGGLSLTNGQTLTIDTKAGTLVGPSSANEISHLTTASVLFPFVTGANAITFTYTGGVLGQTTAAYSYKNRWFMP